MNGNYCNLVLVKITEQSSGEDDFFSEQSGNTYEATLLLPEDFKKIRQGLQVWNEEGFQETIFRKAKDDILRMLNKKIGKRKKAIILFNIFPLRNAQFPAKYFYKSVFAQFACSSWKQIILEIRDIIPDGTNIYIVSYNPDNTFYIEELFPAESSKKEYLVRNHSNDIFPFYSEIVTQPPSSSDPNRPLPE